MIRFTLNGIDKTFDGDQKLSLLAYLREIGGIVSVKDGCSGQAACGACLLEVNAKPALSCVTSMKKINGARIVTIEGFPESLRQTLGRAFVDKGAVQCGFCSPGFLSRAKILLETNSDPTRYEIIHALRFNLCRCTGYVKIIEAIELAAEQIRLKREIKLANPGRVGSRQPRYDAYAKAIGTSAFIDDMRFPNMLYGALKFSDHPRAKVLKIDSFEAKKMNGVVRVFTANDIPGERYIGVIHQDWPVMIAEGETTRYIGDVLAGVVAASEAVARKAVELITVDYEILEPLTDVLAAENSPIKVHPQSENLLSSSSIQRGKDIDTVLKSSAHVAQGSYKTQRVEHGFLETEAAIALPWQSDGVELYVQTQGVYEDQRQIARILSISSDKINAILAPTGGGFGGKEDLTVQGHAAVFSYHLKAPVKVRLSREESIRMHPKRHPFHMEYKLGCDESGRLTGLFARIIGDTGAYASLGAEVLERAAGHATGAYYVPNVDIKAKALYTNNIPCGAMRGFGVNQVTFAMESCVEELCAQGDFDQWQFRYDNVLDTGTQTATGQILGEGVGLKATLLAVKDEFYRAKYAGLACGIKNCGIGNGVLEECDVKIGIKSEDHIVLQHGWTEMGQGVDTVAQQILCEETGIENPDIIEVEVSTESKARAGMTTASRATFQLGNAIIKAARAIKEDLKERRLQELSGKVYTAKWMCDWTTKLGEPGDVLTHYAYGYATHLVVLDEDGQVDTVVAAHDGGRIINPTLFEGQIEGAVVMGLGYALSEELPMENGHLKTSHYAKLGIPRIKNLPQIVVKGVEIKDPLGPYGAKGVGEIGNIPTAGAVANALYQYDKVRRFQLPMKK
ncbi:MAG: selenium-dependent xanthine dehydrogenase [Desulfobacterales bacterium]|nr:MAG: selenium-dependent xanthine dehydrogenase [Desulfobacterales bacterium]